MTSPSPNPNTKIGRNTTPAISKNGKAKVRPNNLNMSLRPPNINLKINEKAKAPTINIKSVLIISIPSYNIHLLS